MVGETRSRLPGRAGAEIIGTAAQGGWHLAGWACEFAGTALLLTVGLSAICLDFATGSPVASVVPDHPARLLITGLLFAGMRPPRTSADPGTPTKRLPSRAAGLRRAASERSARSRRARTAGRVFAIGIPATNAQSVAQAKTSAARVRPLPSAR
jgi:hypothetical protein